MTAGALSDATTAPVQARSTTGVIRGGALSFVGGIVAAIGGFLLTLVVTRGLGAERAGVFFVSLGLFTILSNTLELGADTGLVRSIPRLRTLGRTNDLRRMLVSALVPVAVVGVLAAVLVYAFAPQFADTFMRQGNNVLGVEFLRAIAPYLAFASLATVLVAGTRGFGSVIPFVTIQNVTLPLVRPLLIGILVLAGLATDRLVAATWGLPWVGAAIVAGIIIARQLKAATARDASPTPARPLGSVSREFWSFASARAFAGAAETTLVWLDVLLVGLLVGPYEAGIYAAASRFVTGGTLTMQASRIAISPRLSRLLSAGRTRDAERLYNGGTLAVVASSWPLYIGLACFSSTLLRLFGHSFPRGATALTVLSVAMLIDTGTGNIASVLLMGGRSKWNLVNAGTGLTVDVVVDLLLIPHYGATGAAIGWAASIATINTLATAEVHFLMRLKVVDRAIIKAALAALVCFGIPGLLLRFLAHGAWPLAVWAAIGSVTYGAWWWSRRRDPGVASVIQAFRGVTARRTTGTQQ